jgi:hypothetical protein
MKSSGPRHKDGVTDAGLSISHQILIGQWLQRLFAPSGSQKQMKFRVAKNRFKPPYCNASLQSTLSVSEGLCNEEKTKTLPAIRPEA